MDHYFSIWKKYGDLFWLDNVCIVSSDKLREFLSKYELPNIAIPISKNLFLKFQNLLTSSKKVFIRDINKVSNFKVFSESDEPISSLIPYFIEESTKILSNKINSPRFMLETLELLYIIIKFGSKGLFLTEENKVEILEKIMNMEDDDLTKEFNRFFDLLPNFLRYRKMLELFDITQNRIKTCWTKEQLEKILKEFKENIERV